ncbi:DUF1398 domain-containing protein [Flavobacterium sp.]|uniref:DUF1398 domain-containing protein n=1 Tax=Flavobacterium sp. TaxID=239 RepID=UPI0028BE0248|nr:DUF1398 family protein [Flavobacterium sp.]
MFTLEAIQAAHAKVKSGADFPAYVKDLIELGILSYTTYVTDGHSDYNGSNNFKLSSPAKYDALPVADTYNNQFLTDLKAHQQGQTDYPTFRSDAAKSGIEKWIMDMEAKTCTYYDKAGNLILTEQIPV